MIDVRYIVDAVDRFAGDDPGRSVAVSGYRGLELEYQIRGSLARPGASLLKLPIVLAIYEAAAVGDLDLSAVYSASSLPSTQYATVLAAFNPSHTFTLEELCSLTLITSDNPVASFLLGAVGAARVNDMLVRWECGDSAVGVDFSDGALGPLGRENTTSAVDMLNILRRVHQAPQYKRLRWAMANSLRDTRIPARIPDDALPPHKTGTLDSVVNDAGILSVSSIALGLTFLCDGQPDEALTSIDIANCTREVWFALGGQE